MMLTYTPGIPYRATKDMIWVSVLNPLTFILIIFCAINKDIAFLKVQRSMGAIGKVFISSYTYFIDCIFYRAISRDPIAFPDPEMFGPQRWLDSEGRLKDNMKFFTYGFGRRWAKFFYTNQ